MILFEVPQTSVSPVEAGDNDYTTATTQNTIIGQVSSPFDYVWVKCKGVTSYAVQGETRVLEDTAPMPDGSAGTISKIRHGWQHDLFKLSQTYTVNQTTIVFTGTNIQINEVLVLKSAWEMRSIRDMAQRKRDDDSLLYENENGERFIQIISGTDRLRWETAFSLDFTPDDENFEVFLDWIEKNADRDVVVAPEPELSPWRFYRSIFMDMMHQAPYLCNVIPAGNNVRFTLKEKRKVNDAYYNLASFTTETDGVLFFNHCPHYLEDKVTDATGNNVHECNDNDFETWTSKTTLDFDISVNNLGTKITHLFLKSTGVTSIEVQRRVAGSWVTHETLTLASYTYAGIDNSLTKITTPLSGSTVRLIFNGINMKIYECMLLNFAGAIKSNMDIVPSKIDKTGIIHEGLKSEPERVKKSGGKRFKWFFDLVSTFSVDDTLKYEDFLDWVNLNPNYVVCIDKNKPNQTFLTSARQVWSIFYLTRRLQDGVSMVVTLEER